MTDRHSGYIIVLEKDIREDDAQDLMKAIKLIKGVLTVKPIVHSSDIEIAQERMRGELGHKLWNILYPKNES